MARKVHLLDVWCVNRSPEYVRTYWSKLVKDNLQSKTIESFTATPDLISMVATMNQVVTKLASMQLQVSILSASQGASNVAVASQESKLYNFIDKNLYI